VIILARVHLPDIGHVGIGNMRDLINLIEAVSRGCPAATADINLNLKNRQHAIDEYHYGPANPNKPENYWKDAAKVFGVTEAISKTMQCSNCAAFDVSDSMRKCIAAGIHGDEKHIDAAATINLSDMGYCNLIHFKCAGARSCSSWIAGGPVTEKDKGKDAY
jgi:hypothetical protein